MLSQTYSRQKSSLLQHYLFSSSSSPLGTPTILVLQKCVSKEIAQALKSKILLFYYSSNFLFLLLTAQVDITTAGKNRNFCFVSVSSMYGWTQLTSWRPRAQRKKTKKKKRTTITFDDWKLTQKKRKRTDSVQKICGGIWQSFDGLISLKAPQFKAWTQNFWKRF